MRVEVQRDIVASGRDLRPTAFKGGSIHQVKDSPDSTTAAICREMTSSACSVALTDRRLPGGKVLAEQFIEITTTDLRTPADRSYRGTAFDKLEAHVNGKLRAHITWSLGPRNRPNG
jgi:hypothetical protein